MQRMFEDWRWFPKKTSIKIALIGDGCTGKTSYFNRIISGDSPDYKFSRNYDATQGCNVCQIEFMIGKYPITVHLFDTAGQEKFGMLRDSYLLGADGIILMYALDDKTTKQNVLSKWLPEIKKLMLVSKAKDVPIVVVGNKNDLQDSIILEPYDLYGIRQSVLTGNYDKFGPIKHCTISVRQDEKLYDPINWLLENILSYNLTVNVKKSSKESYVSYCNKRNL